MKLSELEQRAREAAKRQEALAAQMHAGTQAKQQEAREQLKQCVITWMAQEFDLDADELTQVLVIDNIAQKRVRLNIPRHKPILFRFEEKGKGFAIPDHLQIVDWPSGIMAYSLGDALHKAAERWALDEAQQQANIALQGEGTDE